MQNPRLASRYAKSLIDLSIERNCLEAVMEDMLLIDDVCRQSPEFVNVLKSPVIHATKKVSILQEIFAGKISELTLGFLRLLVTKGREMNLLEIAEATAKQYNIIKNVNVVKLVTAAPVNEEFKNKIMEKVIRHMPGFSIDLRTTVDESLIGGFVVETNNKLYDASIRKRLSEIRKRIMGNVYVSKL